MAPLTLLLLLVAGGSHAWRYVENGKPEGWAGQCTDGLQQSPIDLLRDKAQIDFVEPLEFFNYGHINGTITNNGHSIAVSFNTERCEAGVTAGRLRAAYILHEMHFHWQSEHTIDGKRFPLELHLVHYNDKYRDVKHAVHQHDGLAVIAVLFHNSENGTEVLWPFLEAVKPIISSVDKKGQLPPHFNPIDFLPSDRSSFFRYPGSLTTPPCSEVVTWSVLETTVPVSSEQMAIFQEVSGDHGKLEHNYRRLQDINERQVFLLSDNGASSVNFMFGQGLIISCLVIIYGRRV